VLSCLHECRPTHGRITPVQRRRSAELRAERCRASGPRFLRGRFQRGIAGRAFHERGNGPRSSRPRMGTARAFVLSCFRAGASVACGTRVAVVTGARVAQILIARICLLKHGVACNCGRSGRGIDSPWVPISIPYRNPRISGSQTQNGEAGHGKRVSAGSH
jgi:hypothetical protein